jgi:hypothetical protein
VIGGEELSTTKDSTVLNKLPAAAYEYMVKLLLCIAGIGDPRPAMQIRTLEPRPSNSQSPGLRKVQEQ